MVRDELSDLRGRALELAIQSNKGVPMNSKELVARAEEFRRYLAGEGEARETAGGGHVPVTENS